MDRIKLVNMTLKGNTWLSRITYNWIAYAHLNSCFRTRTVPLEHLLVLKLVHVSLIPRYELIACEIFGAPFHVKRKEKDDACFIVNVYPGVH